MFYSILYFSEFLIYQENILSFGSDSDAQKKNALGITRMKLVIFKGRIF